MSGVQARAGAGVDEATRIDFGRRTVRMRHRGIWLRLDLRTLLVCGVLLGGAVLLCLLGLALGDYKLSLGQVVSTIVGRDEGFARTVVLEWRMPRVLAALLFGAALGASGAVFQSLTRNPLASPDIIGFTTGSYTGALLVIILLGGSYVQVAAGSLVGGLVTAAAVYLLAYRQGVQGFRLIVTGIGVSAMLVSVNTWLMLTSDHDVAVSAAVWGAGSLNSIGWSQAGVGGVVVVALLLLLVPLARDLRQLELGDDAARALGVTAERSRLALVVIGVALIATVTAAAGPIAFVALAAPQVGIRLVHATGMALVPAACTGAVMLCAADLTAQHVLPTPLPVGLVTVVVGGGYLVWLLVVEARRRL